MHKNIVIIGSGWLGWPLAQYLSKQGHQVIATTTTSSKAARLKGGTAGAFSHHGISVIKLLTENATQPATISTLVNCDIMIIAIPPKRQQTDYLDQLQQLLKLAEKITIANILFISSSSVYGDQSGTMTEQTICRPGTASAIAMAEFEQLLLSRTVSHNSVLRLAGLIGPGRHPGRFLAGKVDVANPDAVVNMIEQSDCIGLINRIIMQNSWGKIHLGCAPSHPSRREFYQRGAELLGLTPPLFLESGGKDAKLVDGRHTATSLNYRYQYPDLMAWLEHHDNPGLEIG